MLSLIGTDITGIALPWLIKEGIDAAKQIRARHPGTGVVVLSQYVEEDYAFELLAEGVAGMGYLLKERVSDLDEVARALHQVAGGGSVLDPLVVEALFIYLPDAQLYGNLIEEVPTLENGLLAEDGLSVRYWELKIPLSPTMVVCGGSFGARRSVTRSDESRAGRSSRRTGGTRTGRAPGTS